MALQSVEQRIAEELEVGVGQVRAAVGLLDEGSTEIGRASCRERVSKQV